jgi:hypothetical protein
MNIPHFTGGASLHGLVAASSSSLGRQRLGYDCAGRYCDCAGVPDCIDMINGKCGGWTRCVVIDGVFRCLCEPRP